MIGLLLALAGMAGAVIPAPTDVRITSAAATINVACTNCSSSASGGTTSVAFSSGVVSTGSITSFQGGPWQLTRSGGQENVFISSGFLNVTSGTITVYPGSGWNIVGTSPTVNAVQLSPYSVSVTSGGIAITGIASVYVSSGQIATTGIMSVYISSGQNLTVLPHAINGITGAFISSGSLVINGVTSAFISSGTISTGSISAFQGGAWSFTCVSGCSGSSGGIASVFISSGNVSLTGISSVFVSSMTPGTAAANLGKAEDSTMGDGDTGVASLSVRRDSDAARTNADNDYTNPTVDSWGDTKVSSRTVHATWLAVLNTITTSSVTVTATSTTLFNFDLNRRSFEIFSLPTNTDFLACRWAATPAVSTDTIIIPPGANYVPTGGVQTSSFSCVSNSGSQVLRGNSYAP